MSDGMSRKCPVPNIPQVCIWLESPVLLDHLSVDPAVSLEVAVSRALRSTITVSSIDREMYEAV